MKVKTRKPSVLVGILIIILIVGLIVGAVLLGDFGSGSKVTIACSGRMTLALQTPGFRLGEGTVEPDTSVLSIKDQFQWPWETGSYELEGEIVNYEPASWDANINGGTATVNFGQFIKIVGGEKSDYLEFRHLTPGTYTVDFTFYEVTGMLIKDRHYLASATYEFSFTDYDSTISSTWSKSHWNE